jgi:hypothetical protein
MATSPDECTVETIRKYAREIEIERMKKESTADWVQMAKADSERNFGVSWEALKKRNNFRWEEGASNREVLIHPDDWDKKTRRKVGGKSE